MSQITRCPSCSTSFKVVADQLRISQGWVRCGQCKEVFDASAHLLPAAPPALLPDISLIDTRPPPAPVVQKPNAGQSWGAPARALSVTPSAGVGAAVADEAAAFSLFPAAAEESSAGLSLGPVPAASPVLEVPQPAVPAFLAATHGTLARGEEAGHLKPFSWRPEAAPALPAGSGDGAMKRGEAAVPSMAFADTVVGGLDFSEDMARHPAPPNLSPASIAPLPKTVDGMSVPAGYELPFAVLRDDEDMALDPAKAVLPPVGFPALELPTKPTVPVEGAAQDEKAKAGALPFDSAAKRTDASVPEVGLAQPSPTPAPQPLPDVLALVEDHSPAAVLRVPSREPAASRTASTPAKEDDDLDADQEVSFVVAARRRAFWRKPMVRTALVALLVLSVMGLALQVAVQERDRLAAMDARARPWLVALCAPLRCEIGPQRQIANVVIDSSSFNKARGDSYQLALTMKSKASTPLAMPAVELTLTDAQDQPVLRRVLLPADMGAPMELPARGEWSASVSVIVTTGGAQVAGYRLLAFYP